MDPNPETVTTVLTELLRLYDWRFELAVREKDPRNNVTTTGPWDPEFHFETRRLILRYGTEKKLAWDAARRVLTEPYVKPT